MVILMVVLMVPVRVLMVLRPWRNIVPLMKFLIQRGNALIKNGKCKLVLERKNASPINVKTQNAEWLIVKINAIGVIIHKNVKIHLKVVSGMKGCICAVNAQTIVTVVATSIAPPTIQDLAK